MILKIINAKWVKFNWHCLLYCSTEDYPHPLHMAVAIGKQPGVIRHLIMMFGVDKCDEYNRTPLMFAALGNKVCDKYKTSV